MARTTRQVLDDRLLTHHPAGQACVDVCRANGWQPSNADVLRLVQFWDRVRQGRHSETDLSPTHLEYARWLYQHGKINEGEETSDARLAA
jgi:hypothetical protein